MRPIFQFIIGLMRLYGLFFLGDMYICILEVVDKVLGRPYLG